MSKKGIIFDLDGTLWDASQQVVPAWNIALGRHKELHKQITAQDMKGFMGKQLETIASMMLPDMDLEDSKKILMECCKEEQVYLSEHGATLYPQLEETLKKLKAEYSLYIVSNCQDGYVQAFLNYHKLWDYFDDIEMSGRTGKCKGENIKMVIERNNLSEAVYVGDTITDFEGAKYAKIPFIHAAYGFGEVKEAKFKLDSFSSINKILKEIF